MKWSGFRTTGRLAAGLAAALGLYAAPAFADAVEGSKILGTSGIVNFEGSAGGGLVPWAFIGSYGSDDERGASVFVHRVQTDDFRLQTTGILYGHRNRFELSLDKQWLRVDPLNLTIEQHIIAAKIRLYGDTVYGAVPQIAAGLQYKRNTDPAVAYSLGADDDSGVDYYLAASKVWLGAFLGRNISGNVTLRYTEANQAGLLGFGGGDAELVAEGSLAIFLNRYWAAGIEYRQKPDALASVREDDWKDVFIAWFPAKSVSLAAAYTDLGSIAGLKEQDGFFLSIQFNTGTL